MRLISWFILTLLMVLSITRVKTTSFSKGAIHTEAESNKRFSNVRVISSSSVAGTDTLPPYALTDTQNRNKAVLFAPGIISTGDADAHPTFSDDGRTLYFLKVVPFLRHWTTVKSQFKDGQWSTPEVAPFSGRYKDSGVFFSNDGNTLFFVSSRPVKSGGKANEDTDIWKMQKTDTGWSNPQHLAILSSPGNEWFPTVTNDGTIYFGSERREGNLGPETTTDLWRSRLVDGQYTEPENLGDVINTPGEDIEGYIAPDENFLIFSSDAHRENYGAYDLYISYNQEGRWSEPQNLGDEVNSSGWEFGAKLSPDGSYLFFTSNRSFFDRPPDQKLNYEELIEKIRGPGNGLYDIYQIDASILPPPPEKH